jgi:beta-catenin-like protein 1
VKRLLAVAGSPDLYPEFARTPAVPNLLALLSHENTDIAGDVLDLLKELTEEDVIEDSVRSAARWFING